MPFIYVEYSEELVTVIVFHEFINLFVTCGQCKASRFQGLISRRYKFCIKKYSFVATKFFTLL